MIYVFFTDGFEEIEALTVVDVLRRAGKEVEMVSLNDDLMVIGSNDTAVLCTALLDEVELAEAELLVLPGGLPGATNLADNEQLGRLLLQQHEAKRPIAAICAAPLVLGRLGILDGQTATCYPGFEPELKGATVLAEGVVVSNHITTGLGPAYALDFALQLVETHCGKPVAEAIRNGMLANK